MSKIELSGSRGRHSETCTMVVRFTPPLTLALGEMLSGLEWPCDHRAAKMIAMWGKAAGRAQQGRCGHTNSVA